MSFRCVRCGKELLDHTLRELDDARCSTQPPLPVLPQRGFTATELGYVSPEAIEATGEVFDLRVWQRDAVPRHQRLADSYAVRGEVIYHRRRSP